MSRPLKFYNTEGKPSFEHCICVFMDVLGSVERQKPLQAEAALAEFQRFYTVISREVQNMNKWGAGMDEDSYWRLKVFTDNILLGYPLHSNELLHAEPEVFLAATHIAHYQLEMAREGFFIRGGISMGPLFIDDYIAYGPALNDAYEMEHKIARDPRVVVGPTMRQLLLEQLGRHSPAERALQNRDFLVDPDGQIFIHYLSGCLGESQEGSQDVDRETLGLHKQHIEKSLLEFVANPTVWAKYSWLACYHDYTVREWVEQGWLDSDLYIDSKLRRPTPVKLYSLLTTEVAPQE